MVLIVVYVFRVLPVWRIKRWWWLWNLHIFANCCANIHQ